MWQKDKALFLKFIELFRYHGRDFDRLRAFLYAQPLDHPEIQYFAQLVPPKHGDYRLALTRLAYMYEAFTDPDKTFLQGFKKII
jgi:hypothetical protein